MRWFESSEIPRCSPRSAKARARPAIRCRAGTTPARRWRVCSNGLRQREPALASRSRRLARDGVVRGFSADWLALREPADTQARDVGLTAQLASLPPHRAPARFIDLACGTGAN